jgi:hypothetical protein
MLRESAPTRAFSCSLGDVAYTDQANGRGPANKKFPDIQPAGGAPPSFVAAQHAAPVRSAAFLLGERSPLRPCRFPCGTRWTSWGENFCHLQESCPPAPKPSHRPVVLAYPTLYLGPRSWAAVATQRASDSLPRHAARPLNTGSVYQQRDLKHGVQPTMTTQNSLSLSSRASFPSPSVAPAANASTKISASPRRFTLMRTLCALSQKPQFLSPLFATLTHSRSCKSFACHSYENTGMASQKRPQKSLNAPAPSRTANSL